jgi:hypothetical protein
MVASDKVTVVATCTARDVCATCTTELCAERLLLDGVKRDMLRRGKPATLHAMRRAIGAIVVERRRRDGTWGCSLPCCACTRALRGMDVRVWYTDRDGVRRCERSGDLQPEMVTLADARRWRGCAASR